jgi:ankyrin repeat protein
MVYNCIDEHYDVDDDYDRAEVVSFLIQHGLDVNIRDAVGDTALLTLAKNGGLTPEVIEILHKAGADISAVNTEGQTSLNVLDLDDADCESVMTALIEHGVDVNISDNDGNTALLTWAMNDGLTANNIEMLHRAGTEMTAVNGKGQTALHIWKRIYITDDTREAAIDSLIQHGVGVNVRDTLGNTSLLALAPNDILTLY